MIVLDTNVVSELTRLAPNGAVVSWIRAQPPGSLVVPAITEAELRYGAMILPAGRRRTQLLEQIDSMLTEDFGSRILPFDSSAARAYAAIASDRRATGRPISDADAQIAGIVQANRASLATRNVADFQDCGITVVNPWLHSD